MLGGGRGVAFVADESINVIGIEVQKDFLGVRPDLRQGSGFDFFLDECPISAIFL